MSAARAVGIAAGFAAALGLQARLQADLGRDNRVRSVRQLSAPPSPWGLRIAAGGLEEAASDALWLTVLPRLGKSWVEPERKAGWIERSTAAMIATNPRALTPTLYASIFLERLDPRSPALDALLKSAMDATVDGRRVNEDAWELPHQLGMTWYLRWTLDQKDPAATEEARAASLAEAKRWLKVAATRTRCPTMVLEFLAALERRSGNELEGWQLYLFRAATAPVPSWREYYEREADKERVETVRHWCRVAKEAGKPFPPTPREAAAHASPAVRRMFEAKADLLDAFLAGVELDPATHDVWIPSLRAHEEREGRERMVQACRQFEARHGARPRVVDELAPFFLRGLPRPPRHGTRWDLDPSTGDPIPVPDPSDPRLP